jgi:hypothetical protein
VFNATFNNISVISWLLVLLVEETRVSGENHRPVASPQNLMDKLNVFDDVLRRSTLCLKQVPGKISEIEEKL